MSAWLCGMYKKVDTPGQNGDITFDASGWDSSTLSASSTLWGIPNVENGGLNLALTLAKPLTCISFYYIDNNVLTKQTDTIGKYVKKGYSSQHCVIILIAIRTKNMSTTKTKRAFRQSTLANKTLP